MQGEDMSRTRKFIVAASLCCLFVGCAENERETPQAVIVQRSRGVVGSPQHADDVMRVRWFPISNATGYVAYLSCPETPGVSDQVLLTPSGCETGLVDGVTSGLCESDVSIAAFSGKCSNVSVSVSALTNGGESSRAYPLLQ